MPKKNNQKMKNKYLLDLSSKSSQSSESAFDTSSGSDSESSNNSSDKSLSNSDSDNSESSSESEKSISESEDSDSSSSTDKKKSKSVKKKSNVNEEVVQKKRGRPKKITTIVKKQEKNGDKKKPLRMDNTKELMLKLPIYDEEKQNNNSSEKNIFTVKSDNEYENDCSSLTDSDDEKSGDEIKILKNEKRKLEILVKRLKTSLAESRASAYAENGSVCIKNQKSRVVDLKLININKNNELIIVDKTNVACWWCSYNFDTLPCFIPDRYFNNTYYVFGCFCTYSCAMAYNINMNDSRNSTRTSLIKKLYLEIFGNTENMPVAPERELLEKFGGPLTIQQFRDSALLCKKEYKMQIPPLIPLLSSIDETNKDNKQVLQKPSKKINIK